MNEILQSDAQRILSQVDLNPLAGKTVLIVGSNGLIGSQLVRALYLANKTQNLGVRVIGVSRSEPNLLVSAFTDDPLFTFYSRDLVEGLNLSEKADYILHFATYAQPKKFLADPLRTIKLNTVFTEELLNKSIQDKATFLFASSSEIYGSPDAAHIPTPETYFGNLSCIAPRSAYGESKRLGEAFCAFFRDAHKVNAKIARISMVYGPGISIDDDRVLGHFLRKALTKRHIDMLDHGRQERTWCYISDCASMLFKVLLEGKEFVYNVAGVDTLAIKDLAASICELTGAKYSLPQSTPNESKELTTGADRVQLDISKLRKEFNWNTFVPMSEGLQRLIDWNKQEVLPSKTIQPALTGASV